MYNVIQGHDLADLIVQVSFNMNEGWIPTGGIIVVQYYGQYIFAQAMMKFDSTWYGKDTMK